MQVLVFHPKVVPNNFITSVTLLVLTLSSSGVTVLLTDAVIRKHSSLSHLVELIPFFVLGTSPKSSFFRTSDTLSARQFPYVTTSDQFPKVQDQGRSILSLAMSSTLNICYLY